MSDETFAVPDSLSNQRAIAGLEALGKRVIRLPSPAVGIKHFSEEEASIIRRPDRFDWVVFEDVRTASDLEEIAASAGLDLFDLDAVKICAAGEPVADRLRFCQVHADLIPAGLGSEDIAAEMTAYEGGTLAGVKVLSLGSADDGQLKDALAAAGAEAIRVVVHEQSGEAPALGGRTKSMLIAGGVDGVYFASSVDVADVERMFRSAGIGFLPESVGAFCGDRETKTALEERGIEAALYPIY